MRLQILWMGLLALSGCFGNAGEPAPSAVESVIESPSEASPKQAGAESPLSAEQKDACPPLPEAVREKKQLQAEAKDALLQDKEFYSARAAEDARLLAGKARLLLGFRECVEQGAVEVDPLCAVTLDSSGGRDCAGTDAEKTACLAYRALLAVGETQGASCRILENNSYQSVCLAAAGLDVDCERAERQEFREACDILRSSGGNGVKCEPKGSCTVARFTSAVVHGQPGGCAAIPDPQVQSLCKAFAARDAGACTMRPDEPTGCRKGVVGPPVLSRDEGGWSLGLGFANIFDTDMRCLGKVDQLEKGNVARSFPVVLDGVRAGHLERVTLPLGLEVTGESDWVYEGQCVWQKGKGTLMGALERTGVKNGK